MLPALRRVTSRRDHQLHGIVIAVHFDSYEESIKNLYSQIIVLSTGSSASASYEMQIVLISEAGKENEACYDDTSIINRKNVIHLIRGREQI
jgi:hypothetical protein